VKYNQWGQLFVVCGKLEENTLGKRPLQGNYRTVFLGITMPNYQKFGKPSNKQLTTYN
jgi:hypothetical protein